MSKPGCQHLSAFKASKGTDPFGIIHKHFISCTTDEARKRKVRATDRHDGLEIEFYRCQVFAFDVYRLCNRNLHIWSATFNETLVENVRVRVLPDWHFCAWWIIFILNEDTVTVVPEPEHPVVGRGSFQMVGTH